MDLKKLTINISVCIFKTLFSKKYHSAIIKTVYNDYLSLNIHLVEIIDLKV